MKVPPLSSIDGSKGIEAIDDARANAAEVVIAAIGIEDLLKKIILGSVFSEVLGKKSQVEEFVLDSDWCGFNSKIQVLMNVIKHDQLMLPPQRDSLEKAVRTIMKFRNALAHGQMVWDGHSVQLQFFESGPKSVALDCSYWNQVEAAFLDAYNHLQSLHSKVVGMGDRNAST